MAKRKKNANVDPDAPPVPQWETPTEDVEWRDWMKTSIWGSEDIGAFGEALSNPFILPLPFFSAPDRARLSKSAAKALDDAIPIFEQRLAQSHDAPKISDLLNEKKKKEYLANTSSGCYRLYLTTLTKSWKNRVWECSSVVAKSTPVVTITPAVNPPVTTDTFHDGDERDERDERDLIFLSISDGEQKRGD